MPTRDEVVPELASIERRLAGASSEQEKELRTALAAVTTRVMGR